MTSIIFLQVEHLEDSLTEIVKTNKVALPRCWTVGLASNGTLDIGELLTFQVGK